MAEDTICGSGFPASGAGQAPSRPLPLDTFYLYSPLDNIDLQSFTKC